MRESVLHVQLELLTEEMSLFEHMNQVFGSRSSIRARSVSEGGGERGDLGLHLGEALGQLRIGGEMAASFAVPCEVARDARSAVPRRWA